jgi:hypothetical protein
VSEDIVIRYPLTAEIKKAGNKASINSVRAPVWKRLGALVVWMIVGFGIFRSGLLPELTPLLILVFVGGMYFQIVYHKIAQFFWMRKIVDIEKSSVVGADGIEVILAANGIKINADGIYTLVEWRCIERVTDLGKFLGLGWAANTLAIPYEHVPEGISKQQLIDRVESWRTFA